MAARLTPEQVQRAWTDQDYFNSLTPQQKAQAMRDRTSYSPQGIANAQAAAGVEPAIPATAGDGAAQEPKYSYSPLSVSDKVGGSIRYPEDIGYATDYMIFQFYQYVPPFGAGSGAGGLTYKAYNQIYNQTNIGTPATGFPQIILYMPEDVSASYKADWTGKRFSNVGAGILASGGSAASGKFKDALDKISEPGKLIFENFIVDSGNVIIDFIDNKSFLFIGTLIVVIFEPVKSVASNLVFDKLYLVITNRLFLIILLLKTDEYMSSKLSITTLILASTSFSIKMPS